ncbi:hypothetical protein SDC9_135809 [bioreactor metagenome]|uniref:Uncharacterized protein n=1 Tax=bioreactor metagenome TaxID=1076179 RepID=A0A645DHM2_9ZZZZ
MAVAAQLPDQRRGQQQRFRIAGHAFGRSRLNRVQDGFRLAAFRRREYAVVNRVVATQFDGQLVLGLAIIAEVPLLRRGADAAVIAVAEFAVEQNQTFGIEQPISFAAVAVDRTGQPDRMCRIALRSQFLSFASHRPENELGLHSVSSFSGFPASTPVARASFSYRLRCRYRAIAGNGPRASS